MSTFWKLLVLLALVTNAVVLVVMPLAHADYTIWAPPTGGLVAQRVEPNALSVKYMSYDSGIPTRVRKEYPDGTVYNHYYTVAGGVVTEASVTWTAP